MYSYFLLKLIILKVYTNWWEAIIGEYQADATTTIVMQTKLAIGFILYKCIS